MTQLTLSLPPHRNRQLFSDHYLDNVLPRETAWRADPDEAASLRGHVRAILDRFQPTTNEAQTEHDLVRPILELLGHTFEVQPPLQTPGSTHRPDYILYRDGDAQAANRNVMLTDANLQGALAVADAKYWDRPLDQAIHAGQDAFTNKNPGYQISFYV